MKLSLIFNRKNKIHNFYYYKKYINVILVLVVVQIIYGAFSAGLDSGKFWNTFPLIEGRIIPDNLLNIVYNSDPGWVTLGNNFLCDEYFSDWMINYESSLWGIQNQSNCCEGPNGEPNWTNCP